jgi:hypothetical protein
VKLSDLQLTAYDFAAIILPGCICLAEVGIAIYGIRPFWIWSNSLSLSGDAIALLAAFGAGHLVSQAADECAQLIGGKRILYRARDAYWASHAEQICKKLESSCQVEISPKEQGACDRAYDICLTIIGSGFAMRKVFSFVSGLSLSLWILSIAAAIPILITFHSNRVNWQSHLLPCSSLLLICAASSFLAWRRSQLYIDLADTTVFRIFEVSGLITKPKQDDTPDEDTD